MYYTAKAAAPSAFDIGAQLFGNAVEVWPDNWPTVELFMRLRTQWRASFGGFTGLDYAAVYPLIDRLNLSPDEWIETLDDLRAMESAALDQMHET